MQQRGNEVRKIELLRDLRAAPNKRMQWSAASEARMIPSVLCAAPTDANRYTCSAQCADGPVAAPSRARTAKSMVQAT
jgi:hypothetical protein